MADFEKTCQDRRIDLYVLPPRSPKLNGGVERTNGTWMLVEDPRLPLRVGTQPASHLRIRDIKAVTNFRLYLAHGFASC